MSLASASADTPRPKPWNEPRWRSLFIQAALLSVVLFLFFAAGRNALVKMQAQNMPTSFGFWNDEAKFDISQSLIPFERSSPNSRAFVVGLLNTLQVASLGIVFATILGFAIGAARLSQSWLVARLATIYVETIRNIPLLLQLLFWYNAVLKLLPEPRDSFSLLGAAFLNIRGFSVPQPVCQPGFEAVSLALGAGVVLAVGFALFARKQQRDTGRQYPVVTVGAALILGLPLVAYFVAGQPLGWNFPTKTRFNVSGGLRLTPEFTALLFSLSVYTASFIAEIVRGGILAVSHGQTEAARALGLAPGPTRRLIVLPQAMRVIIPPLTSQYLNLTKNSSLAVFIGYPDFVQVFAGSVLGVSSAAVQCILITMAVYLFISLVTSALMNIYNSRMALKER